MRNLSTKTSWSIANLSRRKAAGIGGIALLLMSVLAPIVLFGVLDSQIVPEDASTTVSNIVASPGMFRMAGVALVIVALFCREGVTTPEVVEAEIARLEAELGVR